MINKYDKGAVVEISTVFEKVYHVLSKGLLKRDFFDFVWLRFSQFLISEIYKLWRSSFFSKYSKFSLNFKNVAKIRENWFYFWNNCISISSLKLSLTRTEYLSSGFHVLTDSSKIVHFTNRQFFQLNFFPVINKYDKGVVVQILAVFGTVYPIVRRRVFSNRTF